MIALVAIVAVALSILFIASATTTLAGGASSSVRRIVDRRRVAAGFLVVLALGGAGTTTADSATFTYDAPIIARVEAQPFDNALATSVRLNVVQRESASPSSATRGTSTSPLAPGVATNTVDDVLAGVRATGRAGEAASGIVGNTQRIPSLSGTAAYRIPDELGAGVLGEVNNVSSLSYTSQLRVFAAYAQQEGLQFNLYVRGSTTLSGPLQTAVDSGSINLIRSLPG